MRRCLPGLVLMLALAAPGVAHATVDLNTTPQTPLPAAAQRALAVAPQFWGRQADCPNGIATYENVSDWPLQAAGCILFFRTTSFAGFSPNDVCWMMLHEYGHAKGLDHWDTHGDPHDVMTGDFTIFGSSGKWRPAVQGQGWCYAHGFYRRWSAYNRYAAAHPLA